ncbi:MAG: hypothetical protein SX243_02385 [Acidobacteriota bacterium]|nr:hypothetical protein [Acidobacteriota bacterium]
MSRLAKCGGQYEQGLMALKAAIDDPSLDPRHRALAVALLGDLFLERSDFEKEGYFMMLATRGLSDPDFDAVVPDSFQQASRISVEKLDRPKAQESRLVDLVSARFADIPMDLTREWAARELCDRGSARAEDSLRSALGPRLDVRDQEEIELCGRKVALLLEYEDPKDAFLMALSEMRSADLGELNSQSANELQRWAVEGLLQLDPELGEKELRSIVADSNWKSSARSQAIRRLKDLGYQYEALVEIGVDPMALIRERIYPLSYYQERGIPMDPCARPIPLASEASEETDS